MPDGPLPPLLRPGGGLWSAALLQPVHRLTGAHQHRVQRLCRPAARLFHRAFQLSFDRTPEEGAAKRIFSITEPDKLSALWSAFGHEPAGTLAHHINFAVLEEEHCRLAFFRGAFLAAAR